MSKDYYRYEFQREKFEKEIRETDYDLALVGSFLTYWYPGSFEVVELLKNINPF